MLYTSLRGTAEVMGARAEGEGSMICRHCKKELEENPLHKEIPRLNKWRHAHDHLYTCFDEYLHTLGTTADPELEKK